jgi:uncharacterized metal-binding protein
MLNIHEAVQKIKKVGSSNVRVIPMDGQPALTGLHKIEIRDQGVWITIVEGVQKRMAEDIVTQAINKVILG